MTPASNQPAPIWTQYYMSVTVRRGHLLWADSPMNLDAGVVGEPGMFEALVDIAGALNERYNLTKSNGARVWSNVDVPGKVGFPPSISPKIQPRLHKSAAVPYLLDPDKISGARYHLVAM